MAHAINVSALVGIEVSGIKRGVSFDGAVGKASETSDLALCVHASLFTLSTGDGLSDTSTIAF